MINPVAAPGMAVEIGVSTFGPAQQLGMRLGQILGSELSRMRADAAFATSAGSAIHAPSLQADSLRAQHASVLGNAMLGLSTQTDLRSEGARTSAHHIRREAERVGERDRREDEENGNSGEHKFSQTAFTAALHESLLQFRELAAEAGYSGTPVAVALPAHRWIKAHAPADNRCGGASDETIELADALVLCLAFDGSLGEQRMVLGMLFRADRWVGSLEATWTPGSGDVVSEGCAVHVVQPASMSSEVIAAEVGARTLLQGAENLPDQIHGIRVKIDDTAAELQHWCWQATQWTWH